MKFGDLLLPYSFLIYQSTLKFQIQWEIRFLTLFALKTLMKISIIYLNSFHEETILIYFKFLELCLDFAMISAFSFILHDVVDHTRLLSFKINFCILVFSLIILLLSKSQTLFWLTFISLELVYSSFFCTTNLLVFFAKLSPTRSSLNFFFKSNF